jgi:hypothetical protein
MTQNITSEADQHSNCCDIVEIKLQKKQTKTKNWKLGEKNDFTLLKSDF